MRRWGWVVLAMLLTGVGPALRADAHQNGCHAAHSCPSDTGSYVCGDTGHYTYCGYGPPAASPSPSVPSVPAATSPPPLAASTTGGTFADPAFQSQWQAGETITPNFWGPLANAHDGQQEPYKEASGGQRLVQYFDKGRMELTNGTVTNGLLASELVKGRIQIGDATFQPKTPPAIPVAGDPDNPGPTYAQLATTAKPLFDADPDHTGAYTQAAVSESGDISVSNADRTDAATFVVYDDPTQHNVPKAFADYRTKAGLSTIGYALCEPFYATVKVAGQQKPVMVQVFERRVLTYTASNPDAFKVEMGNIGQHYYQWRYPNGAPSSSTGTLAGPADLYPNPSLTPGDVFPTVTAAQVCVAGYSASVRNVTEAEKRQVAMRYGFTGSSSDVEYDHFIPLELGGSNALTNLWPEPYVTADAPGAIGAKAKDRVENALHSDVCKGFMTLQQAQEAIRSDWYAVYVQIVG